MIRWIPLLIGALAIAPAHAQQPADSATSRSAAPWQGKVLYGGGPSIGAPPSDYTGATAPATWCLIATGRPTGDMGMTRGDWTGISRSWLRQVLGDTSEFGTGWRKVLGGAPRLAAADSIIQVLDETTCQAIAATINRDLLGWQVGPPPVVVYQVHDYLIAFPSNANMGEFGLAVGMTRKGIIQGVSTW